MTSRDKKYYTLMSAVGSATFGKALNVEDFRHIMMSLDVSGTSTLTIKFQGSIQETEPTWDDPQSATNSWDYVRAIDLQSGSAITGDTGITTSGADFHTLYEINVNGLKWVNVIITAWTAGDVTAKAMVATNQ